MQKKQTIIKEIINPISSINDSSHEVTKFNTVQ